MRSDCMIRGVQVFKNTAIWLVQYICSFVAMSLPYSTDKSGKPDGPWEIDADH
jgi:hypothetical protein